MMRVNSSKVFELNKEKLIEKIKETSRWKGIFDTDTNSNEIILNTFRDVENLIDLFDERYTRSDFTDTEYDTYVKSVAQPTGQ